MVNPMNACVPRTFSFWMSSADKIVSFHPMEGYQRMEFSTKDRFLGEILAMSYDGYRFQ